ncbi:hypothetical protein [Escherichia coli]|uniref:hypothetical protein n=1 Tax=Escherichia coli TaxID=562 RepID=UPI001CDAA52D|nr:hypothetical protein [Escherichia coli]
MVPPHPGPGKYESQPGALNHPMKEVNPMIVSHNSVARQLARRAVTTRNPQTWRRAMRRLRREVAA